ncbi:MAG: SRPBCC family protein [Deltaproteobacteria bacterium]|nr:SRPBCC family protein [Deltaproteobacteria bacterium]
MAFTKALPVAGVVVGAALGAVLTAGALLLAGPGSRRRRGLAADRVRHLKHETRVELDKAGRDLRHRAQGIAARRRRHDDVVDDHRLVERARAALGHVCSHPHAIQISGHEGVLLLEGLVLANERRAIVNDLRHIPGVHHVVDQLEAHADAEGVPALQGGHHRQRTPELLQGNWSPAARVVVAAGGASLLGVSASLVRRAPLHPLRIAAGAAGALLVLRSVSNRDLRSWRGPFDVDKSIFINAPRERVFALFATPEQFPRFMTHVKDVRRVDEDHYQWRIDGPFRPQTSTCEITRWLPADSIAFRDVDHPERLAGEINFLEEHGGTRLEVCLTWAPPAGALGFLVARALQRDPKHFLDADLLRLKSLLENGRATGNAEQVTLQELSSL